MIGVEVGFDNLTATESTSTHGNEASFETVVEKNPDYIFVMDRDSAIGADGAQTAKEIMENELIMATDAYKNEASIIADKTVYETISRKQYRSRPARRLTGNRQEFTRPDRQHFQRLLHAPFAARHALPAKYCIRTGRRAESLPATG